MTYTVLSVFSGIGGLDLAAHWAGFETVGFIEREPFCQKVLEKHWPGVPIHSDVFEYHSTEHVDVVCGGFPCQPFSVAGNRKGADDERYLLPEMLRIISKVKPHAVLFENVPGFPSLSDGAEFKYLLRSLAEMGFDAEWGHLRASDSGAPHQRERWFCVAYAASLRCERYSAGQGQDRFQQGRASELTRGNQTDLGNTQQSGCPVRTPRKTRKAYHNQERHYTTNQSRWNTKQSGITVTGGRATEPGIRRVTYGLPGGMDFAGWPARPGEDQYSYEPPRVVSEKIPDRAARLKALGNAVVPQVVYPLFLSIHEWLTEIKEAQQ